MSAAIGKFIDESESDGKPDSQPNLDGNSGHKVESGKNGIGAPEPESEPAVEFIEPSAIRIDGESGEQPRRTRDGRIDGRSKQARTTRKTESGDLSGLSIKDLLIGIHSMGAALTGMEELEIDDAEAKKLADATTELGKIYGHSISPKTLAWTNFAAACGVVYGPRIIAYRERVKQEAAKRTPKSTPGPIPVNNTRQAPPPTQAAPPKFPTPSDMWPEAYEGN